MYVNLDKKKTGKNSVTIPLNAIIIVCRRAQYIGYLAIVRYPGICSFVIRTTSGSCNGHAKIRGGWSECRGVIGCILTCVTPSS